MPLTWLWVMWAGKSVDWDLLNHHLYLPFSLLTGRFRADLFAAGPQSYQNPLGYIPFYAFVSTGMPSWLVGTALTLMHTLAVGAVYGLTVHIWGSASLHRFWRLTALAAAWITPIFLTLVGTSSIDPLTSVMVLWALWAVLHPDTQGRWRTVFAGCMVGLAFVIKPTSAVFVVAVGLTLVVRTLVGQADRWQAPLFGAAATGTALLGMGPWSAWLWSRFGNPLFPLFNQYFGSAYAPLDPIVATRFLPRDMFDYVRRVWDLMRFDNYVSSEAFVPDIRPLALAILVACAAMLVTYRAPHRWALRDTWRRPDVQLFLFVFVSHILWLKTSGNARYAIPLFVACGVLLVRACQVTLPMRIARLVIGLLLSLQMLYYGKDGDHRLSPAPWSSGPYLTARVSPRLQQQPMLHLSLDSLTSASLAPFLQREGVMVNAVGQMSLPTTGPLGQALSERLSQWQGRTRFLFRSRWPDAASTPAAARGSMDAKVYHLGLQVDWSDCETIWLETDPARVAALAGSGQYSLNQTELAILSCRAVAHATSHPEYDTQRIVADRAFGVVQAMCPRLFAPVPFVSDHPAIDMWSRSYLNNDFSITVSFQRGVLVSRLHKPNYVFVGNVETVLGGNVQINCESFLRDTAGES